MRTITLWEPWATLMAIGAKQYETRSWRPYTLGDIAIHAAKRWAPDQRALIKQEPFASVLAPFDNGRFAQGAFPFGCVLAVGRIVNVYPVEQVRDDLGEQELAFGDYSNGRFAWKMELEMLPTPMPAKGAQGFWNCEVHTERQKAKGWRQGLLL